MNPTSDHTEKLPRLVATRNLLHLHPGFAPPFSLGERMAVRAAEPSRETRVRDSREPEITWMPMQSAHPTQSAKLLSLWERPGEGCWPQASIAIKANLRGLGYGG